VASAPNGVDVALMRKLARLLTRPERLRLALLLALTPVAALGEAGAVAAMLPFLSAVVDPSSSASSLPSRLLLEHGLATPENVLTVMGAGAFLALLLTNGVITSSLWFMLRFSWNLHHRLSLALMHRYLHQPYAYFSSQNSAALTSGLVLQVEEVTHGFIVPLLTVISRGMVALVLVLLLGATEPLLAGAALALITSIYSLFYFKVARRHLADIGARRWRVNRERLQIVSEAFGGIKDVKLLHAERAFEDAYRPLSRSFSRDQTLAVMIGATPRYIVEALAFGGVVLVTLVLFSRGGWRGHLLPLLGMFAFAGYRLMPSIQNAFAALMQMRTHREAFDKLYSELVSDTRSPSAEPDPAARQQVSADLACGQAARERLTFDRTLQLSQVSFRYAGAGRAAIEGLNLTLKARTTIGIVGPTGSGKTTFVDLLLGLLTPSHGQLIVDGVPIDASNVEHWQRTIGYVPQHIYLSDTSVTRNVAFGVPEHEIDQSAVEEACRSARIHDFIMRDLPGGYATSVGERGARLSGGERQRIGIARALYRRPEVLVLDEATSALDRTTESEVIESIRGLAGDKTIIMIAHRESTLRDCDVIYRITRGRLELIGSYSALVGEKLHHEHEGDRGQGLQSEAATVT
jgi:ATP-binding cassette subfamily C protein